MLDGTAERLSLLLRQRPDPIIVTAEACRPCERACHTLLGAFPHNTSGVFALGGPFAGLDLVAVHEDGICDALIAWNSSSTLDRIDRRYQAISLEPRQLSFLDRIIADSRDVARDRTAGLRPPHQAMLLLLMLGRLLEADLTAPVA
jgi:aspartate 4-decarboxylase